MIKIFSVLYLACCVTGCLWIWYPPYSSFWDEDIWVHKENNTPPTKDIVRECYSQSLLPFETKVVGELEIPVSPEDQVKANDIDGACLYQKGFRFNASYKYCYRFDNTCKQWNKYRN
ncbi:hypothetical protein C3007_01380 [Avibacterium gallinarum]|uniref:Uncharacterized protein n=1 Tax=Avibacterium gallinarum TaxID=755 RepID=A0A379AVM5_AVIGA|nr:hypothetical protein [Avibacterium gallinarum]POY45230.1 hypothetical protein C3007_01380 [Avibacterium gallinarum]TDP27792.1 hypothetical protein EV689_10951 [Avibacterium gallinarum]SUB26030.1 Uncharacterised protein [Avibacterium gallinarum]